jgi:tetratricopeptide (TPR) repeat protein
MSRYDKELAQAFTAFDEGRFYDAELLYQTVLTHAPDIEQEDHRSAVYMLAFVHAMQGRYDQAHEGYQRLYERAVRLGDHQGQAILLHQLGMVERMRGAYATARRYFDQELTLRNHNLRHDWMGLSANAYEFGHIATLEGDYRGAEGHLQRALDYGKQAEDAMCQACALRGLGELRARQEARSAAAHYWTLSAAAFRQAGDERGASEVEAQRAALQV